MNILYYGCHEILEYDEVRLFRALGHSVYSLSHLSHQLWKLRPPLPQDAVLSHIFNTTGCINGFQDHCGYVFSRRFLDSIDVVIAMSDASFVENNWTALRSKPVIWRTVGMGIEIQEYILSRHRREGMKIVRYSPSERRNRAYLGEDAVIRFYVQSEHQWQGSDASVLTFSNDFVRRYPEEYAFSTEATCDIPLRIGGSNNDGLTNSIGAVEYERQLAELRDCRAYLYSHGVHIPYTLNFIEAWASGIPVVARDPNKLPPSLDGSYSEIGSLIQDGETGFLVSNPHDANAILNRLLSDHDFAHRIGSSGILAAQSLFGYDTIAAQWKAFLESLK